MLVNFWMLCNTDDISDVDGMQSKLALERINLFARWLYNVPPHGCTIIPFENFYHTILKLYLNLFKRIRKAVWHLQLKPPLCLITIVYCIKSLNINFLYRVHWRNRAYLLQTAYGRIIDNPNLQTDKSDQEKTAVYKNFESTPDKIRKINFFEDGESKIHISFFQ